MAGTPDKERTMRVGDIDYFGFIFWGDDMVGGIHVDAGTVSANPGTGLTLQSGSYNISAGQDAVYVWATAVTAGDYDVTFVVNFSDGKKLNRIYRVTVF